MDSKRSTFNKAVMALLGTALLTVVGVRASAAVCDWTEVESLANQALLDRPTLDGLSLQSGTNQYTSYVFHAGRYDDDTVVPLASGSKLLSAVLMLRLVDQGLIDLDAPVSNYLPQFSGQKGQMTVRQLFSHTSGLPGGQGLGILGNEDITLEQAVDVIACCVALDYAPGEGFLYGGLSMHVAGRVAEVVTGKSFERLFELEVARPLGLTTVNYQGAQPISQTASIMRNENYRIAGGARSSLRDYGRVLEMLANGGMYRGQRILSDAAMTALIQDYKSDVPLLYEPSVVASRQLGYGLGGWLHFDASDPTRVVQVSSKGAFDAMPWFNIDTRSWGIVLLENRSASLNDEVFELFDQINAQMTTPECRGPHNFSINAGLSGFWFDPNASGQGLLIDVMAERQEVFGGWMVWDLEAASSGADLGDANQRWLT
ncbi:MAG: serine hydrolase domain-containing protein, partial [Pseudomonadota bacterium]